MYKNIWRALQKFMRSIPDHGRGFESIPCPILNFSSLGKEKKKTHEHFTAFLSGTLNLYIQLSFFFLLLTYVRMDAVIFASVKTPPAPSRLLRIFRDFRNIARSIRVLLLSLLSMGHAQRKRSVPSSWFPHWAGQGRPPNKSFRCVCVYQLVTSIRFLF